MSRLTLRLKPASALTSKTTPKSTSQAKPKNAAPAAQRRPNSKSTSKPRPISKPSVARFSSKSKPVIPAHEHDLEPQEERVVLSQIRVHRLPESGLAYQLSLAAHILLAINQGYSMAQISAEVAMPELARSNVLRLTFDALRHWGSTQFWMKQAVAQPPAAWVEALLCVALPQLVLHEENEFTLVNEAVVAVNQHKPHAKGLVNAILRRYLRERDAWDAAILQHDVARYNHPQWWINRLKSDYPDDWQAILAVNNARAPMTLRVNARACGTADYAQRLTEAGLACQVVDTPACAEAIILQTPCAVTDLPDFELGAVSVQDAGAQLALRLLDVAHGQRVLDACAAPGGKTMHILEHFEVDLWALEREEARAARIFDNLARLNQSAEVRVVDATQVHQWWDSRPFDRILLDAPCSGSGIVRRHPEIRWLRDEADIVSLAQQQAALLRAMWKVLAVGGRLLYCTCSIFTTEAWDSVAAFLSHTPNAVLRPIDLSCLDSSHALHYKSHHGCVQLLPNLAENDVSKVAHDGFFYALIEKISES